MTETNPTLKILCLEDAPRDAEIMKEILADAGYEVDMDVAGDEKEFISSLEKLTYDVILADYTLPGFNASEALKFVKNMQPVTPFICISGTIGEDKAVELVKQGATDYVLKDRMGRLVFAVNRALHDATRQKEWEMTREKLRDKEIIELQNEELRKLNATKDKFFSIIAHDLRSPFNAIVGFSHMLMNKVHEMERERIERIAQVIHESSVMAMDLLTNLFEWSLSQSGNIEFNPEEILIADLIRGIEPIFVPSIRQKNMMINYEVQPNLTIHADKEMLATVIRNLISNALKFTYPGGKITISAKKQDKQVIVSVADTGIGIPKSKLNKLFRIDKNVSTPGTGKEKGTGLGLVLCHEFVEKHGGRIWVTSKEHEGSVFYVSLPAEEE